MTDKIMTWMFIWLSMYILPHTVVSICVFGEEDQCILPCHCQHGSCNKSSGKCDSGTCKLDPLLSAHNPEINGRNYWTGEACQIGNIAAGKPTYQIATYYNPGFKINATSEKAIDGNISSYAYSRSSSPNDAYWMVDLQRVHVIMKAYIIANSLGNSLITLENYTVYVGHDSDVFSHDLCGQVAGPLVPTSSNSDSWNWNPVYCKNYITGRYVSVRKTVGKYWMPLHEIAIIGYPVSNVRLGYCERYEETQPVDLLNLRCEQCQNGWLEPNCQTRTSSPEVPTSVRTLPQSTDSTSTTEKSTTLNPTLVATTENYFTTTQDNNKIPPRQLSVAVVIIIVILSIFALLSSIVIPVLFCKLRKSKSEKRKPFNNEGQDVQLDKSDDNYTSLDKNHMYVPQEKVYLTITPDQQNASVNYLQIVNNPADEKSMTNTSTNRQDSDGYLVPSNQNSKNYNIEDQDIYTTIDD